MDFSAILDKRLDSKDYEKPPTLPQGSYTFMIEPKPDVAPNKNGNLQVIYQARVVEPKEDVDPDEIALINNLTTRKVRLSFFFTEAALHRFGEFTKICGIDQSISTKEAIDALVGTTFTGRVVHEPNEKDPTSPYANIAQFAEAE